MFNHLPILMIVVPIAISFLVLLLKKYVIPLSIISIGYSFLSLLALAPSIIEGKTIMYHLGGWPGPLGISIRMDGLSFFFALIVLLMGLLAILFSLPEKKYNHYYYFLILMLISSMLGAIFTDDIFNLYILYDLVTISTYLLIAYHQGGSALRASLRYLLMSAVGLSLYLLSVGSIYSLSGTLQISNIADYIPSLYRSNPNIILMSLVLFVTCMGIKMAMVPLHGWLPDAHSLAPSPVSAILSGVVIKVGIYGLLRILFSLFGKEKSLIMMLNEHALIILGAITLLFGAMMALMQSDLKRMLAYSSISQVGLIIIGISIMNLNGIQGALFHVLNHALVKGALFFCAGIIIFQSGTRKIKALHGFVQKNPFITFCFIILSLGMIGIPPMNGFMSKFLICLAAIEKGYTFVVIIIVIASLITAAYYFQVIQYLITQSVQPINRENTGNNILTENNGKTSLLHSGPVGILTGFSLLLGIFPSSGLYFLRPAVEMLLSIAMP